MKAQNQYTLDVQEARKDIENMSVLGPNKIDDPVVTALAIIITELRHIKEKLYDGVATWEARD